MFDSVRNRVSTEGQKQSERKSQYFSILKLTLASVFVAGTDESPNFDLLRDFMKVVDFVEIISKIVFAEYSTP